MNKTIINALVTANVTLDQAVTMSDKELLAIKGIGKAAIQEIRDYANDQDHKTESDTDKKPAPLVVGEKNYPSLTDNKLNLFGYTLDTKNRKVSRFYKTASAPKNTIVTVTNQKQFANLTQHYILEYQKKDTVSKIADAKKVISDIKDNDNLSDTEKEEKITKKQKTIDDLRMLLEQINDGLSHVITYQNIKDDKALLIAMAVLDKPLSLLPLANVTDIKNIFAKNTNVTEDYWSQHKIEMPPEDVVIMQKVQHAIRDNAGVGTDARYSITSETPCTSSFKLKITSRDVINAVLTLYMPDKYGKVSAIAGVTGKKNDKEKIQRRINLALTQRLYTKLCGNIE